ncbi:unnamed protein product, partial [Menidia menidia]
MMTPSSHVFLMRNILHHYNCLKNAAVMDNLKKSLGQEVTLNSYGQAVLGTTEECGGERTGRLRCNGETEEWDGRPPWSLGDYRKTTESLNRVGYAIISVAAISWDGSAFPETVFPEEAGILQVFCRSSVFLMFGLTRHPKRLKTRIQEAGPALRKNKDGSHRGPGPEPGIRSGLGLRPLWFHRSRGILCGRLWAKGAIQAEIFHRSEVGSVIRRTVMVSQDNIPAASGERPKDTLDSP